jgi:hypothetical protein
VPDKTGAQQARDGAGRWRKGASGNPVGRPKGSRNRMTQLCADLLGAEGEVIMKRLVEQAAAGEPAALRLAVERLVPIKAARDRLVEVELPNVARVCDLVDAAAAVVQHAASSRITLSEAREFMNLLEGQRKLIETVDLAVRVEALERAGGGPGAGGGAGEVVEALGDRVKRVSEWRRGGNAAR